MTQPAKYLFDNSFDVAEQAPPSPLAAELEELRLAHAAELENVRQQAFEEGREQGLAQAAQAAESQLIEQIRILIDKSGEKEREIASSLEIIRKQAGQLAMAIASRLAGSLLERYPQQAIEGFFGQCLALLPHEASLQIYLSPELAAIMQPRLEAVMAREGRKCSLAVQADEEMAMGDCSIIWRDGGIERRQVNIERRIEELLAGCLSGHGKPPQTEQTEAENAVAQPAPASAQNNEIQQMESLNHEQ